LAIVFEAYVAGYKYPYTQHSRKYTLAIPSLEPAVPNPAIELLGSKRKQ